MALNRRSFSLALGASVGLGVPGVLKAQSGWPKSGTIRIVVPFAPAGATDVIARIMAERFSQLWSNQVIVENRPGAGGNIGADTVAKSIPDGNSMLVFSVGMATNLYLYKNLTYDPIKDFAPVSLVAMVPNVLCVPNSHPAKTLTEFVAMAKAKPGTMTFASSGIGTSLHLSGELFNKLTGAKMTHLPYKGAGETKNDLIAGRVDCIFDNITSMLPLARGGQVRALGITTATRSKLAPDLPPINDAVPGFDVSSWFAIFAPAKVPKEILTRMTADARAILMEPAVIARLNALGGEIVGSTAEELGAHLANESQKWGTLIKELGITAG